MKRTSFIIAFAALVLSFGLSYGQVLDLDNVDGNFHWSGPQAIGDTLATGTPITFNIRWNNNTGVTITGSSNGFRVYSPDGAVWDPITHLPWRDFGTAPPTTYVLWPAWEAMWDNSLDINPYSITGTGADTVGFSGSNKYGTGAPDAFSEIVFSVSTQVAHNQAGKTLCIDSTWYRPSNNWVWSTKLDGDKFPTWGGPYCFDLYEIPNLPPTITNCPVGPTEDHCKLHTIDFDATDPDGPDGDIVFSLGSGSAGTIDGSTGMWSYQPTLADVTTAPSVEVIATDNLQMAGASCTVTLNYTNRCPEFTTGCGTVAVKTGGAPDAATIQMGATNGLDSCDAITYSLGTVSPTPTGTLGIDANSGLITFQTDAADADMYFTVPVIVSDGLCEVTCDVFFDITAGAAIAVSIEACDNEADTAFQGQHYLLDVTLDASKFEIGGFDLLIAYDNSALSFQSAVEGGLYGPDNCKWEYFTYRYGANGNCSNACPSGLLRVIGIAETNNGDAHPVENCVVDGDSPAAVTPPVVLFTLDFLISNDRTLECSFVPVRFYWMDCGDNSISSGDGNILYISSRVFSAFDVDANIADPGSIDGYPTYLGAQDSDCFVGNEAKAPQRDIDFFNGGICIACADSIDARGDVNLNEIGYEIADAVVFSNYFVEGISAFHKNVQGQIAATDVNADGIALSVADLVYLIRVVVGDALPYPKPTPILANYTVTSNGVINVDTEMGAAFIVAQGDVTPTLHADNMDMRYAFNGTDTRILVYSTEAGDSFSGNFITVNGSVVSLEMATYEGTPVSAKLGELPSAYSLHQNFPNPFNPSTSISFELPHASDYKLTVYNVTGQEVAVFAGSADAGTQVIEWMADGEASGIYFYKLDAGDFTATKKMILLK